MDLNKVIAQVGILFLVILISGCGLTGDFTDLSGSSGLESYAQERDEILLSLESYIGKSSEEVRKAFGKPKISAPGWYEKTKYEEKWTYKIDKGIPVLFPDQYLMLFYFNQGKVVVVDAM